MFTDLVLFDVKEKYFGFNYHKVRLSDLGNYKKKDIVILQGNTINRNILENKDVGILVNPDYLIKKDFLHFRNSGLNQVLCNIAKKNDIAIGFSFSYLLNSLDRPKVLGRMMQNVRLCRKFKVKMLISSFAKDKYELRSQDSLQSFGFVIGMTPEEVKKALFEPENIINKLCITTSPKG